METLLFSAKKLIGSAFMPVPVVLLLLAFGLGSIWLTRRRIFGSVLVLTAGTLLFLASFMPVADRLLRPLEERHPPLTGMEKAEGITWIVVLCGGFTHDERLSGPGRLAESSLARLAEGIRIHRLLPGSRLLVSEADSEFAHLKHAALALGAREEALQRLPPVRDTYTEALAVRELIGNEPVILVTSASHMPRSVLVFKKIGLDPLPAPAHFLTTQRERIPFHYFLPDAGNLVKTQTAFYERLGLLRERFR